MSNRTIRWDDPAYSVKSSEDSSNTSSALLSNTSITLPIGNSIVKPIGSVPSTVVTSTSWRELKTRDGRAYFYNSVTQKTVWEMPQEYGEYLNFIQKGSATEKTPATNSEGDQVFWEILKERRITSKWTWEEALRAIITHPNYKCIPTLQERKASFQRYCQKMRLIEEEEARLQSLAIKEGFKSLLASDPKITSDTKWSEVVDKYSRAEAFVAVPFSKERVQLFEEYQSELRRTELEIVWARRKESAKKISAALKSMNLSLNLERGKIPDWHVIKDKLIEITAIPDIDPVEYLLVFEEHIQELLIEFQATRRAEKQSELIKEFEYRENFKLLLKRLVESEEITPFSTWSSIYPLLNEKEEYKNITKIYLYGSSPIDLFYEVLDLIQQNYTDCKSKISEFLIKEFKSDKAKSLPRNLNSFTQFKSILKESLGLEGSNVKNVFTEIYGTDAVEQDRLRLNAYKHLLKHRDPPIKLSDQWQDVKETLKGKIEFEEMFSEEDREVYFLKFKKWLVKHEISEITAHKSMQNEQEQEERYRSNIRDDCQDRHERISRWDKKPRTRYENRNSLDFEAERDRDSHKKRDRDYW